MDTHLRIGSEMDFKKFSSEAGAFFNRAIQFTEEKLGQAEKTEYDEQYECLVQRADKTKDWTEKMVKQMEAVLQPNPTVRAEQAIHEKVQAYTPSRQFETDHLGAMMISAGTDFGSTTGYGSALVKCGQTQQKLAETKRQFVDVVTKNYIQPLKTFLDDDFKTILKERKLLETKRLDLDVVKNKLKRARPEAKAAVEDELRLVQVEFDRQHETTRLLLEAISSTHTHHLRCLQNFSEAEMNYYTQCYQLMKEMHAQLGVVSGADSSAQSP